MTQMFKPVPVEQEPKRNNRFMVKFPEELGIESYLVQTVTRPKLSGRIREIPYLNKVTYSPSNYKWENFEITLIDVVGPSTSKAVMNMIDYCEKRKTEINELKEESLENQKLFTFTIQSLDPTGETVEIWTIDVAELLIIDFGKCDYGNDDLQMIKIILKPLNCKIA